MSMLAWAMMQQPKSTKRSISQYDEPKSAWQYKQSMDSIHPADCQCERCRAKREYKPRPKTTPRVNEPVMDVSTRNYGTFPQFGRRKKSVKKSVKKSRKVAKKSMRRSRKVGKKSVKKSQKVMKVGKKSARKLSRKVGKVRK